MTQEGQGGTPAGLGDWLRLLPLWLLGFTVLLSYALARPASESLFLEQFGSEGLPYAWLGVGLGAVLVTALYNSRLKNRSIDAMFGEVFAASLGVLLVLLVMLQIWPKLAVFGLYLWKDLYIVVLVETFWAMANCVFAIKSAKLLYGSFLLAGSLGGVVGNFGGAKLATVWGSVNNLWLLVPILLLASWGSTRLVGRYSLTATSKPSGHLSLGQSLKLFADSGYLLLLLFMMIVVQLTVNLVDFQFAQVIEQLYPDIDARTKVLGSVYGTIEGLSAILQLVAPLALRFVGLAPTLLIYPVLLGASVYALILAPAFVWAAAAKVISKCFDYSWFRAGREILYIPLAYDEKTQGKAVVDIFGYRVAKALASSAVFLLGALGVASWVGYVSMVLVIIWIVLLALILQHFRRATSASESR